MKNSITTLVLFIGAVLAMAQLHFDYVERTYVRQIASNEIVIINAVNQNLVATKDLISFNTTEFPSQVKDYLSKINAK